MKKVFNTLQLPCISEWKTVYWSQALLI